LIGNTQRDGARLTHSGAADDRLHHGLIEQDWNVGDRGVGEEKERGSWIAVGLAEHYRSIRGP
jgi:hypothetical protein